jgi:hypothetical protein
MGDFAIRRSINWLRTIQGSRSFGRGGRKDQVDSAETNYQNDRSSMK